MSPGYEAVDKAGVPLSEDDEVDAHIEMTCCIALSKARVYYRHNTVQYRK